jgi:hypothetical protein
MTGNTRTVRVGGSSWSLAIGSKQTKEQNMMPCGPNDVCLVVLEDEDACGGRRQKLGHGPSVGYILAIFEA